MVTRYAWHPYKDHQRFKVSSELTTTDEAYQRQILQGVSRTFALTIPALPPALCRVVGNAYLLCRIADTIEDEATLTAAEKRSFSELFMSVLDQETEASEFAHALQRKLSMQTPPAEHDLIENTPRVIRLTRSFSDTEQAALRRCVRIMSSGMAEFQEAENPDGLEDLAHLDRYCYHVAGVVGEMLTELFCEHVESVREHRETLLGLAVSFGQGLQMTNILKDVWEDHTRGACWLPRDIFEAAGFDLHDLEPGRGDPGFSRGMAELIGVARVHLANALEYTLYFPSSETGIRRFCLWALGMAVLTLRRIYENLNFASGSEVKISRLSVKSTVLVTNLVAGNDATLRFLFSALTRRLPGPADHRVATSSP